MVRCEGIPYPKKCTLKSEPQSHAFCFHVISVASFIIDQVMRSHGGMNEIGVGLITGAQRERERSDVVRKCVDSDQRSGRNMEPPDVQRKNWSEPCAWSMCVCVCEGRKAECVKEKQGSSHVRENRSPCSSYTQLCHVYM